MSQEIETGSGFWTQLWKKPSKRWLLGVPVGGYALFIFGVVFWTGFNVAMDLSNSEAFCISCHVMRENVYKEYTESVHYSNRSGVRAVCADCHVPKNWFLKFKRKLVATSHEIPHWILGTINTREKFLDRRSYLAERVWEDMRRTNSRECRNCHERESMKFEVQDRFAARRHKRGFDKGESCIDCHQGVAHDMPTEDGEKEEMGTAGADES